jgi:dipeptidyl aminopeptidase/acylaminoacyl peptidase
VTMTAGPEGQVAWSPDSRRIVYSSEMPLDFARAGSGAWRSTTSPPEGTQVTAAGDGDYAARFSPDGKSIAFVRGGTELRVLGHRREEGPLAREGAHRRSLQSGARSRGRPTASGSPSSPRARAASPTSLWSPAPEASRNRQLSSPTPTRPASPGRPTARSCCSTRASEPRHHNWRASI